MNGLLKRMTALEELAAERERQKQRREMRDVILSWPEFDHLTPDQLDAATDEALAYLARTDQWRREGLSDREIMQQLAAELGLPVAELDAACRAVLEGTA